MFVFRHATPDFLAPHFWPFLTKLAVVGRFVKWFTKWHKKTIGTAVKELFGAKTNHTTRPRAWYKCWQSNNIVHDMVHVWAASACSSTLADRPSQGTVLATICAPQLFQKSEGDVLVLKSVFYMLSWWPDHFLTGLLAPPVDLRLCSIMKQWLRLWIKQWLARWTFVRGTNVLCLFKTWLPCNVQICRKRDGELGP